MFAATKLRGSESPGFECSDEAARLILDEHMIAWALQEPSACGILGSGRITHIRQARGGRRAGLDCGISDSAERS